MRVRHGVVTKAAGLLTVAAALLLAGGSVAMADCGDKGGDAAHGDKIFHETCVTCHGEDGHGAVPGAPDFTKTDGVLSQPEALLRSHIRNGFQAPGNPMAMPPKGANSDLSDQDLLDVQQYLHKRFLKCPD